MGDAKDFPGAKRSPFYRSFRDDAVRRRLRRKRRVLTKAIAALALAVVVGRRANVSRGDEA